MSDRPKRERVWEVKVTGEQSGREHHVFTTEGKGVDSLVRKATDGDKTYKIEVQTAPCLAFGIPAAELAYAIREFIKQQKALK